MSKIPPRYDPKQVAQAFNPQINLPTNKSYIIPIPPPNITGALHIGHALVMSAQDALLRYQAINGYQPVWLVGSDHSGISGQLMLEKALIAKGITNATLEQKQQEMEVWKAEKQEWFAEQSQKMFLLADWDKGRFTLDEAFAQCVTDVFVQLFDAGYIHRGKRLVYWDIQLQTAISDLEVEMIETEGEMHEIFYPGVDCEGITVATTRPETLFGDVAVAIHPDDTRYKHLIGKKVTLPLTSRHIPIIADKRCIQDKGTGAVKITPAHDHSDYAIGKDHELERIEVINQQGQMTLSELIHGIHKTNILKELNGQDRAIARKLTIEKLDLLGLLKKTEQISHSVPYGSRSQSRLEALLTTQWFCDMGKLAQNALAHLDKIEIYPKSQQKMMVRWLENIEPWCLSRQLWWGHRIPAWYDDDGNIFVGRTQQEAEQQAGTTELQQDCDVLDTWFSSALWTFAGVSEQHQPADTIITGHDILNAWISRMITLTLFYKEKNAPNKDPSQAIPFKKVVLLGLIKDKQGRKMSKTIGNVINPLTLIEKHGADALRLALLRDALPEKHEIRFSEHLVAAQNPFLTKIWNCIRLYLSRQNTTNPTTNPNNPITSAWNAHWLHELSSIRARYDFAWKEFRFADTYQEVYSGIWDKFANCYLEGAKKIWDTECNATVNISLKVFIQMLYPLAPGFASYAAQHLSMDIFEEIPISRGAYHQTMAEHINIAEKLRWFAKVVQLREFSIEGFDIPLLTGLTGLTLLRNQEWHSIFGPVRAHITVDNIPNIQKVLEKLRIKQEKLQQDQNQHNTRTPKAVIEKSKKETSEVQEQTELLNNLTKNFN